MTAVGCRFLPFVVIVAFIAGCTSSNGSPSPSPTPPLTSSTSTTTSPEPSPSEPLTTGPNVRPGEKPPVYPALAKRHTAQGALAFAAYYYQAFDWGYATNDPYLIRSIGLPSCSACRKYVHQLAKLRSSRGVLLGGRIQILSRGLRSGHFNFRSDYVAFVVVRQSPIVVQRPGEPPTTVAPDARKYSQFVFISWKSDRWRVVEVAGE